MAIIILAFAVIAATVGLAQKPLEPQLRIDPQSPGVWPKYAASTRIEMIDQYACMRLIAPYQVTTEPRKGEVQT